MTSFLVALDSFKGSLSSVDANNIVKKAILDRDSSALVNTIAISDGGEGFVTSLYESLHDKDYQILKTQVLSPDLKCSRDALFLLNENTHAAVLEAAEAVPITYFKEPNAFIASSYSLGELILNAINKGVKDIYIGLGGSATNDLGLGLLQALGVKIKLYGKENFEDSIVLLDNMKNIEKLDFSNFVLSHDKKVKFHILCDVTNPLLGKTGATYIFGPQKGISKENLQDIDEAMSHFNDLLKEYFKLDYKDTKGAGAAGGLGACLLYLSYKNYEIRSGLEFLLEHCDFNKKLQQSKILIIGEGAFDGQSLFGKAPYVLAHKAKKYGLKVVLVCGRYNIEKEHQKEVYSLFDGIFSIVNGPMSLEKALDPKYAKNNLYNLIFNLEPFM